MEEKGPEKHAFVLPDGNTIDVRNIMQATSTALFYLFMS